ncbi:hypothetical protein [Roseomonas elaeocarpi]|uniref:Uncharacterized protein n=1 Tax=Roseomonas elaeocarpi TaxID=907779 RepID=A0ABV6JP79_9PROT
MNEITPVAPRRIAPQLGPRAWVGEDLTGNAYMVPLGAEHAAELRAGEGEPTPKLDALAATLAERLKHGLGFALLRGLPRDGDPAPLLRRLGRTLGQPGAPDEEGDVLLLRATAPTPVMLTSAAELHNRLLAADRAALSTLYAPAGEAPAVFTLRDNVFTAHRPEALDAHPALAALLLPEAALALHLDLRPGDVLVLDPLRVWTGPMPEVASLRLRAGRGHPTVPPDEAAPGATQVGG